MLCTVPGTLGTSEERSVIFPPASSCPEGAYEPGAAWMPEQELAAENTFGSLEGGGISQGWVPKVAARGGCSVLLVAVVFWKHIWAFIFQLCPDALGSNCTVSPPS